MRRTRYGLRLASAATPSDASSVCKLRHPQQRYNCLSSPPTRERLPVDGYHRPVARGVLSNGLPRAPGAAADLQPNCALQPCRQLPRPCRQRGSTNYGDTTLRKPPPGVPPAAKCCGVTHPRQHACSLADARSRCERAPCSVREEPTAAHRGVCLPTGRTSPATAPRCSLLAANCRQISQEPTGRCSRTWWPPHVFPSRPRLPSPLFARAGV